MSIPPKIHLSVFWVEIKVFWELEEWFFPPPPAASWDADTKISGFGSFWGENLPVSRRLGSTVKGGGGVRSLGSLSVPTAPPHRDPQTPRGPLSAPNCTPTPHNPPQTFISPHSLPQNLKPPPQRPPNPLRESHISSREPQIPRKGPQTPHRNPKVPRRDPSLFPGAQTHTKDPKFPHRTPQSPRKVPNLLTGDPKTLRGPQVSS